MNVLEINNVTSVRRSRRRADLSLTVPKGELVPRADGPGKTTFFNLISGFFCLPRGVEDRYYIAAGGRSGR